MGNICVHFGIIFVSFLTTTSQLREECQVIPNGPMTNNMYTEYAKSSCTNGTIWWNYPKGSLQVHFLQSSRHFSVCIWPELGSFAAAVYEVTDQTRLLLESPSDNREVCARPTNERVTIELQSPQYETYLISYGFKVVL